MLITKLSYKLYETMDAIQDISLNDKGEVCFRFRSSIDIDEARNLFHFDVKYAKISEKYYVLYRENITIEPKKKQTEIHKELIKQGKEAKKLFTDAVNTIDKCYTDMLSRRDLFRMKQTFEGGNDITMTFERTLYMKVIDKILSALERKDEFKDTMLEIETKKCELTMDEKWIII